ncbi:unannotated protein [freshwater metagenome]|uniref:Unannotated protein n=1 Tax=freshwater metagenome TaxID=449393 RepID=A0A6J7RLF3_9ZZZZ|nr:hypothetical protein [Actinomycetota bacterium]MSX13448.1 hypothetical protein [Actinomycetota bacterium]
MQTFMIVSTFKAEATMEQIQALIPAEQARAKELEELGIITSIKISMPRRTAFIEAAGENQESVMEAILSLPMAAIWDIEVFPTTPPAGPAA